MPRRASSCYGDLPLPAGWEVGTDFDGKPFFIDHNTKQTTWIDPRDRQRRPLSFADCVGDELPYGWEESYNPQVGLYYTNHSDCSTQLEDPRLQWREQQEHMLKEYLTHAHDDLDTKSEIYTVKQERLAIAQEEVHHLQQLNDSQWKTSRSSLHSVTSVSSKYDPELLKADVEMARKRVARMKQELGQIRTDVEYKERGLQALTMVEQKMGNHQNVYSLQQAQQVLSQISDIKKSVLYNEREKRDLLQMLTRLKDEVLMHKQTTGSSPDVSTLSIPMESLSTASQTDLSGEYSAPENRFGEIVRIRFKYDEVKKQVRHLQEQLAKVEEQMIPGQPESDKDRLLLIQEKEQLLRELRSVNPKDLSEDTVEVLQARIAQLEQDLRLAMQQSNKQIAERLRLNESKSDILQKLAEATHLTSYLESELKSLSVSTLSISSGSSRGSLGSLSASSKGSLNSLSLSDLYSYSQTYPDSRLPELHRWVEKVLQGHSSAPTTATGISPIQEVEDGSGEGAAAAAIAGYVNSVALASTSASAPSPYGPRLMVNEASAKSSLSPVSSLSSLSTPPVSPYEAGPPPSYHQHLQRHQQPGADTLPQPRLAEATSLPQDLHRVASLNSPPFAFPSPHQALTTSTPNAPPHNLPALHLQQPSDHMSADPGYVLVVGGSKRLLHSAPDGLPEIIHNPPLSPISETSSGVCNNISGVNTRSVSAAVSDESVTGDSGVFEASGKSRSGELDDVLEMSVESAQIQIKLKYDSPEGKLQIAIEQARNLSALAFPQNSQVCIKVSVVPNSTPAIFVTPSVADVNNPRFNQIFCVSVPEWKLKSLTVPIEVWSIRGGKEEQCLGGAQLSLAGFDPKCTKSELVKVLSFRFMQPDGSTSTTAEGVNISAAKVSMTGASLLACAGKNMDNVDQLLEITSTKLRRASLGDERPKLTHASREHSAYFRMAGQPSVNITSVKEESSDESTIISSQTSTLTRNQGLEDGEGELSDSADEDEEQDFLMDPAVQMGHLQMSVADDIPEETDDDLINDVLKLDKETNTEAGYGLKSMRKKVADPAIVSGRNSVIRRSKTFSPMGQPLPPEYLCKLNRSDSDSSVKYRKSFQRGAVERRSMRLKKSLTPLAKSHSLTSFDRLRAPTSIDLELDLKASQARLSQLNDEIARLKEICRKFEEAKATGENEPSWFTDNEQLQMFFTEADKSVSKGDKKTSSRIEERAAKLLKQATREAHRLRRSQKTNQPDTLTFRSKMAYLTNMTPTIPVIQTEAVSPPGGRYQRQRHAHTVNDPLAISQAVHSYNLGIVGITANPGHSMAVAQPGYYPSQDFTAALRPDQNLTVLPLASQAQKAPPPYQFDRSPHDKSRTANTSTASPIQDYLSQQQMCTTYSPNSDSKMSPTHPNCVYKGPREVRSTIVKTGVTIAKSNSSVLPKSQRTESVNLACQRRVQSFNEGCERSRPVAVLDPAVLHARTSSEQQMRGQEAQVRRLHQAKLPLIPTNDEQHV